MKSNERAETLQQETALRLRVGLYQLHDTADPPNTLLSLKLLLPSGPVSATVGLPQ